MKTKGRVVAALMTLFVVIPLFGLPVGAATTKSHKVVLQNLTVDTFISGTKTITAHDGSSTSYTITASKAKFTRASGEKASISELFELSHNDSITVWGTTTDGTNINGSKIRNNSTRKIKGKYLATISTIAPAGASFPPGAVGEFSAIRNGNQMLAVFTYGYTKYKFGKHKTAYTDLQVGDIVDIRGITKNLPGPLSFSFSLIYHTDQVTVISHGAAPASLFPTSLNLSPVE